VSERRTFSVAVFCRNAGEVLLVRHKRLDLWLPVGGEVEAGEDLLEAARREFEEETALRATGPFTELGAVVQKSGKTVHAWAFRGDCDPASIRSNTFTMEWPPRSGRRAEFPEVDRARFFSVEDALGHIHPAEGELVARLQRLWTEGRLPP